MNHDKPCVRRVRLRQKDFFIPFLENLNWKVSYPFLRRKYHAGCSDTFLTAGTVAVSFKNTVFT